MVETLPFVAVSAYIHNNPVKAGIAGTPEEYKWSSYNCFVGEIKRPGLVDTKRILWMFSNREAIRVRS
jgi:hypothetical protein